MSLVPNRILEGAAGNPGYKLQRSLRFRSSASAYLSRTPASTSSQTTCTWSGWVKRVPGVNQVCFSATQGTGGSNNEVTWFQIGSDNSASIVHFNAGSFLTNLTSPVVFRDPSSWYHFVFQFNTTNANAALRARVWVNGSELSLSGTQPSQNMTTWFNVAGLHTIGKDARNAQGSYFDGYLAEVNFIDGQALTPSSFGETDAVTGVWIPKKYSGTYGTNGFYLDFLNNTSATTLAYDKSGNNNNWTANNISTTAGATYDSMTDVPTLTSATAANYCVLNPLKVPSGQTVTTSNANLTVSQNFAAYSTMAVTSGKWYWECVRDSGLDTAFGIAGAQDYSYINASSSAIAYTSNGTKYVSGANTSYGSSFVVGDIIGVALDITSGTITFYKNNVSQGSITLPATPDGGWSPTVWSLNATVASTFNFGQRPFSYTPPSGFKALNTYNLPDPTIKKSNQYFDVTLYTGNGSNQTITNGGFQPDLFWGKSRSAVNNNGLVDSIRGGLSALYSNLTNVETADGVVTAWNSNGVSLGNSATTNTNGQSYVGWQWKGGGTAVTNTAGSITSQVSANLSAGFSIVKHTNTGAPATIGHGLGIAPKLIINKVYSRTENWRVYFGVANKYLILNSTNAEATDANIWNNTQPTSSVFSIGTYFSNGDNIISYCFAEIAGFSKFGSYTGNGSADGPFVYCGFRPKYVMIKGSSTASTWRVIDTTRSDYNIADDSLSPNESTQELANNTNVAWDILSNGFKLRTNYVDENQNSVTYIYAAFAENPFKYANAR